MFNTSFNDISVHGGHFIDAGKWITCHVKLHHVHLMAMGRNWTH